MAQPHFSFRLQLPEQELDAGAAEASADLATPLPAPGADVAAPDSAVATAGGHAVGVVTTPCTAAAANPQGSSYHLRAGRGCAGAAESEGRASMAESLAGASPLQCAAVNTAGEEPDVFTPCVLRC